jgi:hypothetical protein
MEYLVSMVFVRMIPTPGELCASAIKAGLEPIVSIAMEDAGEHFLIDFLIFLDAH